MRDFVEMGVLGRAHGIRGEIRVNWYAETLDALSGAIWLQAGSQPARKVTVTHVREHQGMPVISLEGVNDRNAAETLRGQIILAQAEELPPTDDEIYLHELIGLSVVLHETGAPVGTLDHVHFHGEQETWSVLTPDGKELLLPAVPEFVPHMDVDAGVIRIAPPEGLLELYGIKV